ncbi:MAG: HD domain-containing protein [bacterium]
MKLNNILESMDAYRHAANAHKGVTRKFAGEPYINHPKRVAQIVKKFKGDSSKIDDLIKAALLHDTVEDTDTTLKDLEKLFGGLVASLVKELTSNKKEIEKKGKAEYLADKMINMSSWALVIKLSDRLDNVGDFKTASPKFVEKYKKETEQILEKLKKERKLTGTQKRIIKAIEDKMKEFEEHSNSKDK